MLRLDQQPDRSPGVVRRGQQPVESQYPHPATVADVVDRLLLAIVPAVSGSRVRVPGAEVELVELFEGTGADQAAAVAYPVQAAVMDADKLAVAGQPDVAF